MRNILGKIWVLSAAPLRTALSVMMTIFLIPGFVTWHDYFNILKGPIDALRLPIDIGFELGVNDMWCDIRNEISKNLGRRPASAPISIEIAHE